jgi:hypothetical protein
MRRDDTVDQDARSRQPDLFTAQSIGAAVGILLDHGLAVTEPRVRSLARMLRWRARMDWPDARGDSLASEWLYRERADGVSM